MNANELIEELDELLEPPTPLNDSWVRKIITNSYNKLRQLQAENEALKKQSNRFKMAWNMAENEVDRLLGEK